MAIKSFEQLYSLNNDYILPKVQVIDNLTSTDNTKPLAASQGKVIKTWIDEYNNNKGDGGYATLDENGIIYTHQLPSFVDDVLEFSKKITTNITIKQASLSSDPDQIVYSTQKKVFAALNGSEYYSNWGRSDKFPAAQDYGTVSTGVTPAKHKIFVCVGNPTDISYNPDVNKTFRWSGTDLIEISASVALGEVSGTAYDGAKGKATTDKVNKIISTSSWLESFTDPSYNANIITLCANRKQYDANGNQTLNDVNDVNEININAASTTTAGVMSANDKTKLNNISTKAVYVTRTGDVDYTTTSISIGFVKNKFDGNGNPTSANPDVDEVFLNKATASTAGIMSAADKTKLDGIVSITQSELNALLV